jgi:hypothetical protein
MPLLVMLLLAVQLVKAGDARLKSQQGAVIMTGACVDDRAAAALGTGCGVYCGLPAPDAGLHRVLVEQYYYSRKHARHVLLKEIRRKQVL